MMFKSKVKGFNESSDIVLDDSGTAFLSDGFSLGDSVAVKIGEKSLKSIPIHSGPYCKTFDTVVIVKNNEIRIAVRHGKAAKQYNAKAGEIITIKLQEPSKYWEKENAYSFEEINEKTRYKDEESFANFRPLFPNGTEFYRASSPFDDAYGRADSALACAEKYGIKTIIDVADSKKEYATILKSLNTNKRDLIGRYHVFPVGDDSGLYSKEFEKTVLKSMIIIAKLPGPYLIHCRAGKRRSGFICAILQGLAGLSKDEIEADYMISYKNNNGVTYGDNPIRYEYLRKDTIERILFYISGLNLNNLEESTNDYLLRIGCSTKDVEKIKEKLINDKSPH